MIEELPNARIEEYYGMLGIRPITRKKSERCLGPFDEIQVQPDGTILGVEAYIDDSLIVQIVLPNGSHTGRYHSIIIDTQQRMYGRSGLLTYLLSQKTVRRLSRGYLDIMPMGDKFYSASRGAVRYILDEDGRVVASKKVTLPWKKRRKDVNLDHLLGSFKGTDFI